MKKFFSKIVNFLHLLFGINLDAWIHDHVQPSIEFVEKLKSFIDSPAVNIISVLFPGVESLREKMSANLAKAIDILMAGTHIAAEPDWTNKILKTAEYLKSVSPELQSAVYNKLATILTKLSAGDAALEKVKDHSVDLLVQMQYSKMKENATAESLPDVQPAITEAATKVTDAGQATTEPPVTEAVPDAIQPPVQTIPAVIAEPTATAQAADAPPAVTQETPVASPPVVTVEALDLLEKLKAALAPAPQQTAGNAGNQQ